MGRKSNSSSGDGSTTVATVMGLRMIQCGRQTVHVIQPDGQVRQFPVPVKASDLVQLYPHHFVSPATSAPSTTVGRRSASAAILPLDTYLDTGSIYVLLPLPRLFPCAPPHTPHLCYCFLRSAAASGEEATGIGAIKAEIRRYWPVGTSSSSKISPEDGSGAGSQAPRRLWEPPLEIIAEDRVLVFSREDEAERDRQNKGKKIVSTLHLKLRSPSTSSSSPSSSSSSASSSS